MQFIQAIPEFLVSTWLWHFTWGWTQVISNALILFLLLHAVARISWLRAALLSLMAHIMTSLTFSAIISFFLVHACDPNTMQADQYMTIYTNLHYVTISFAALYGVLLGIFFTLFNYAYHVPLMRVYSAIVISAALSAVITPLIC
jgi:hypothetical protein